ncbi:protein FATTY ACID EXPORT 2, chloroplastic [Iris pallida]|uniref:Protein FATTY ACID EXPORT 2, chloroplastic n=1 Tax=Iris pallida TaxID=29817 RepID=A0AAX6GFA0_IRIPA|nr:protein FATTY ACID EXPORT 2, chloroplastic [Iris pallida]
MCLGVFIYYLFCVCHDLEIVCLLVNKFPTLIRSLTHYRSSTFLSRLESEDVDVSEADPRLRRSRRCWWAYGIYEKWQSEVVSSGRDIILTAVLCVHTTSIESRFRIFFGARCLCCASGRDGFAIQEVGKGVPCRRRVACVLSDARWLFSRNRP